MSRSWSSAHDWKSCKGQKLFESSNLSISAKNKSLPFGRFLFLSAEWGDSNQNRTPQHTRTNAPQRLPLEGKLAAKPTDEVAGRRRKYFQQKSRISTSSAQCAHWAPSPPDGRSRRKEPFDMRSHREGRTLEPYRKAVDKSVENPERDRIAKK